MKAKIILLGDNLVEHSFWPQSFPTYASLEANYKLQEIISYIWEQNNSNSNKWSPSKERIQKERRKRNAEWEIKRTWERDSYISYKWKRNRERERKR